MQVVVCAAAQGATLHTRGVCIGPTTANVADTHLSAGAVPPPAAAALLEPLPWPLAAALTAATAASRSSMWENSQSAARSSEPLHATSAAEAASSEKPIAVRLPTASGSADAPAGAMLACKQAAARYSMSMQRFNYEAHQANDRNSHLVASYLG